MHFMPFYFFQVYRIFIRIHQYTRKRERLQDEHLHCSNKADLFRHCSEILQVGNHLITPLGDTLLRCALRSSYVSLCTVYIESCAQHPVPHCHTLDLTPSRCTSYHVPHTSYHMPRTSYLAPRTSHPVPRTSYFVLHTSYHVFGTQFQASQKAKKH